MVTNNYTTRKKSLSINKTGIVLLVIFFAAALLCLYSGVFEEYLLYNATLQHTSTVSVENLAKLWLLVAAIATIVLTCVFNLKMAFETGGSGKARGYVTIVALLLLVNIVICSTLLMVGVIQNITLATGLIGWTTAVGVVIIDYLLYLTYEKNGGKKFRESQFGKVVLFLDIPILLGVVMTGLFMLKTGFNSNFHDFHIGFGCGATAMEIVIGNVAYGVMDIFGFLNP